MLASGARVSAIEYVALLRRIGRREPQEILKFGDLLYSFGLRQAFHDGDADSLIEVAQMGAIVLDASGLHAQAIARLAQAAAIASADPAVAARIIGGQLFFEAASGHVDEARRLEAQVHELTSTKTLDVEADLVGARCLLLDFSDLDSVERVVARAEVEGQDGVASFLLVQLAAALVAQGEVARGAVAADHLLTHSRQAEHRAREIDAEVALIAIHARAAPGTEAEGLGGEAERLMNNHALWKLLVADFRAQVTRQRSTRARATHDLLQHHYDWVNPGYRNSFEGLAEHQRLLWAETADTTLPVPQAPTLFSLPNILASAEAVAMGGTVSAAADWLAWLEAELPADVVTSIEWPACRQRVEALLTLRVGQRGDAVEGLVRSIVLCEERGDTIEAAIGRAQLAALEDDEAGAAEASAQLAEVGIDPAIFTDAAMRIAGRAALVQPALTVPEARVIGRVANGLSHKEIEAELGLPPRGASRMVTNGYQKLGVTRRAQAAQVARERLIA